MNWIIGGILVFLILRFLWRGYAHPSNVMTRQAANMNWVAVGRTDNPNGGKDVLLGRGGLVSKIDWQTGEVHLVEPAVVTPFEDYLTLERWLTLKNKEIHDRAEAHQCEVQAFSDMAKAQEKEFEDTKKHGEGIEDIEFDPEVEQQYKFFQEVQERLRNGPGGDDLVDIDQSFKVSSPEYLKVFHELIKTAIEFGVSPTEVATLLIMAFTAAQEEGRLEPVTVVVVYLRSSIKHLRKHKGI